MNQVIEARKDRVRLTGRAAKLQEQKRLLRRAMVSEQPLSNVLEAAGWEYGDLVYEHGGARLRSRQLPASLNDIEPIADGVPLVSFFSGCGGLDLGMEAAGFQHMAAFEINELFCSTLRANRPEWPVFGPPNGSGDVAKTDEVARTLMDHIQTPFEGLFVGGPPCQPFSIAANQRFSKSGKNFKRTGFAHEENGNLLFDYIELIRVFQPRAFLIENVTGIQDIDGGQQLSTAIKNLEDVGYTVADPLTIDAEDYGIPQRRKRLFIIGCRGHEHFIPPEASETQFGCGLVLPRRIGNVENAECRAHKAGSILRYMALGYGERDQLGRVDRLDPREPSKTVIAGGTKGGGRSHLHPEVPRTLCVRECARLQTFPDDYVFRGATARQFTQVGNAIPPVLGAKIGVQIARSYFL